MQARRQEQLLIKQRDGLKAGRGAPLQPSSVYHSSSGKIKNIQDPLGVLIKASKSVCDEVEGWGGGCWWVGEKGREKHTFNLLLPAAEMRL